MKVTQLFPYHQKHAKLTEFADYKMPLWYTTTTEEHLSVRNTSGIFDVSHMGRFALSGPATAGYLEGLVPTHVTSQPPGKAFYTLLLNDEGGIIDDLIIMKQTENDFLVVVNAANTEGDMKHFMDHLPPSGVEIEDVTSSTVMIALQGPNAASTLQPMTTLDVTQLKRFRSSPAEVLHQQSIISRTGYTGEDGFEIIIKHATEEKPEGALMVWEHLASSSRPCGLAARDSLRLEAGFPLHGSDIDAKTNPFQADLAWVISEDKKRYVGHEAVERFRQSPPDPVKRGVVLERGIPRHGFQLLDNKSNNIGTVTSGSYSPILRRGIALTMVKQRESSLGVEVGIMIRESVESGRLVKPPFYDEKAYGWRRTAKQ
jgi:aminomethyltransferase